MKVCVLPPETTLAGKEFAILELESIKYVFTIVQMNR